MGISNNAPTMSYIHISGTSVVWNNETYMVQDFATNKRYIYWNADTPHQLNASNVMPNRSTKQYLVIVNDNGMHSLVPSTSDDFSISFEGNSNQAIKDRIFGLYEKNEEFGDKFVAIEQDIDGIKSIVGETEETTDGTLIDRMSKIEQRADEINLSVEEVSKKYNDDKETNELRENLNSSIIKLNSTLGTFKSELTDYFKNNEVSSEEQVKIKTQLEILKNNKIILEGYVNTVRLIAESNNQTQDVVALDSAKKSLQIAHDNLHNNVTNAIIDSIISPTENTIIIDSFAKYNLKINELKNTCDDIIILGVGGVITEELANISIKSNEIKLSVSKVEEDFKNDMSIQKLELEGQIRDVNSALGTFEETVNTTFKDGIIDESEKSLLKEKINLIDKEKVDIDLKYNSIYSDTNLSTDIKSELKLKYNNYSNKHSELKSKIESVISDSLINDTEKKEVDTLFKQYANTLAYFHDVINKAIENIAFNSSNAELKKAKEELQNEVSDVSDSVNDLSDTMHGAFQDGILSESEKIAIRQNLSILASEKSDIDKQYTTIYANADLTGTPKTNLKTAYDNYVVSYNSLISTINTILGKSSTVNSTDRNNLTNAFNTHNTKLGLYTVSANNALDSIAAKKAQNESSKIDKKYADIILTPETGILSKVEHFNKQINGDGGISERLQIAEEQITDEAITQTVKDMQFIKDMNGKITTQAESLSKIDQKADNINLEVSKKVNSNSIISAINLSPESIKISSSKINITGFVTFSDLSTPGSTTISGSNITTGYVKGNRIDAKNLTVQTNSGINTLMIDSNGQVELRPKSMTVNTDDKITFLASNNYRNMLLYGGQVCVYNNVNDSFMATIGHVLRSSNSTYRGVGVLAGKGCNTFFIGRDSTWGDILTNRSPNPLGSFFINFESITAQTDGVKGIHLRDITYTNSDLIAIGNTRPSISGFNSIQATSGVFDNWKCAYNEATIMRYNANTNMINLGKNLNVNGFSISGAARVESPKVYMDSLYALNGNYGKQLLRTNGWDMFNGVNWDWQGYNILNANLTGCSISYSLLNTTNQLVDVESSKIKLACEDISKIDENGEVIFDISDMLHLLYDRITKLEEENKELRNLI